MEFRRYYYMFKQPFIRVKTAICACKNSNCKCENSNCKCQNSTQIRIRVYQNLHIWVGTFNRVSDIQQALINSLRPPILGFPQMDSSKPLYVCKGCDDGLRAIQHNIVNLCQRAEQPPPESKTLFPGPTQSSATNTGRPNSSTTDTPSQLDDHYTSTAQEPTLLYDT